MSSHETTSSFVERKESCVQQNFIAPKLGLIKYSRNQKILSTSPHQYNTRNGTQAHFGRRDITRCEISKNFTMNQLSKV